MTQELPSGTVTFLFTDIEGSTKALRTLGAAYADALAEHRRLIRTAFAGYGGIELGTEGDAFFYVFARASEAVEAAAAGQRVLESGPLRVRMGLHTGEPMLTDEGYVGMDVHKVARICSAGHGGQILASEQCAALLEPGTFIDLGLHRLKDLSRPEHIFQLGDGRFPPLNTLHLTNLPIQATPFIGREKEVRDVIALLCGGFKLLTLTGPGGIGKSRLALQCAAEVSPEYPDGVWWIGLGALRDPQLVAGEAARAIGSNDGLLDYVGSRRMLIVFDNFEHVCEAAPLLSELLAISPNIAIMTTSREQLHLSAEHEYAVPPLTDDEAVLLFRQRAASTASEQAARAICARLDRLPLAIELAAARTKALSVEQILERLDKGLPLLTGGPRDAPERQRTLRATIGWSYGLLSTAEQDLFARLAVFQRGSTLEAAESVCDADIDRLQSLIDKSLLRRVEDRFVMLETIREYAVERFEALPDCDSVCRRHLAFFLSLAEDAYADLIRGRKEKYWLERLDPDHDNFRTALSVARAYGDGETELRLAIALAPFWTYRSHLTEGRKRLTEALSLYPGADDPQRSKALLSCAKMAWKQKDLQDARACAEEAAVLFRAAGDELGLANTFNNLGVVTYLEGDVDGARRLYDESIRLLTGPESDLLRIDVIHNIALNEFDEGHYEEARTLLEKELADDLQRGSERRLANTLCDLGYVAIAQHRDAEARELLTESLRRVWQLRWKENIYYCLTGLAALDARDGAFERASRLLGTGRALAEEIRIVLEPFGAALHARTEEKIRSQLGSDEFARFFEEGRAGSLEEAINLATGAV
ncbi:MAG: ATP-binding protein [Actinomycetota bacterium]